VPLFLVVWAGELSQQVAEGSRESSAPHFYEIPPAWHSRAEERKEILRVAHCVTRADDGRVPNRERLQLLTATQQ
jgi:hypothetical protein